MRYLHLVVVAAVGCGEVNNVDPDAAGSPDGAAFDGREPLTDAVDVDAAPRVDSGVPCTTRLLYVQGARGAREIFTAAPDGSDVRNVSNSTADDTFAQWSPDGSRVMFLSTRSGNADIWVARPDGTDSRNLTASADAETAAYWSPDGRKIAFARGGALWVMASDGTLASQLTSAPMLSPAIGLFWSPDGAHLLVGSKVGANVDLFVVPIGAGAVRNVTNTPNDAEWAPNWSPDGSRIAFGKSGSAHADVWAMAADGSGAVNLTPNTDTSSDNGPQWTRDGHDIVFDSNRQSGAYKVFIVSAAGGAATRVSEHTMTSTEPGVVIGDHLSFLAPDGDRAAFVRYRSSTETSLGVVNLDGSNLATFADTASFPSWSPCMVVAP